MAEEWLMGQKQSHVVFEGFAQTTYYEIVLSYQSLNAYKDSEYREKGLFTRVIYTDEMSELQTDKIPLNGWRLLYLLE